MSPLTNIDEARRLPKSLLHDDLDGGLRVATVLELADEIGWTLPTIDPAALQAWFTAGADSKDLLQYRATFEHTLAVMQTEAHIERIDVLWETLANGLPVIHHAIVEHNKKPTR